MSSKQLNVAVVCWRLGPYHHARLNAAGLRMRLFGIESCGIERTNSWAVIEGSGTFQRITLTERHVPNRRWRHELERRMFETLDVLRPQVVAIPGWSLVDALLALCWCSRTRTPAIVMSDSTALDAARSSLKERIKQRLVGLCSSALVAGTRHQEYIVSLGIPSRRVFHGYDVVDNTHFAARADEARSRAAEVRRASGMPESYFLFTGRFIDVKNLSRLIESYARYRRLAADAGKESPWELVLLGDGPLAPLLRDQISALSLGDSVLLPGFKQYADLPSYYGLASAFVLPSYSETWGLVVNEAMACGLPVLVSNRCGCAPDLVKDGVNGYTFDPYDIEQLARLMLKVSSMEAGLPAPCAPDSPSQPSTFNLQPSTALAQMGTASRAIIANWGPERFASGLKAAADKALEVGPKSAGALDRLLLQGLISRGTSE